jgi:RNA polymerase sigma-70 factor (ECF subfamily)
MAVEDAEIVRRIAAGDASALRELYGRFAPPLLALAARMVRDHGAAEEILQDVFVKIWRSAGEFDPQKAQPFTWAVVITRRSCIDRLRRRRLDTAPLPEGADSAFASGDDVRRAAEGREIAREVQALLAEFHSPQRAALELALFSGFTHEEIAAQLEQPVGTVKSWIRRGLFELRGALSTP